MVRFITGPPTVSEFRAVVIFPEQSEITEFESADVERTRTMVPNQVPLEIYPMHDLALEYAVLDDQYSGWPNREATTENRSGKQ